MIRFDLSEETVPEVPESQPIQTDGCTISGYSRGDDLVGDAGKTATEVTLRGTFPVFDIEAAKLVFEPFLEKVNEMFQQAEAIVVNNETTKVEAVAIGTSAMSLYKKLESVREDWVAEPNQYVKSINSLAHALTDKLHIEKKGGDRGEVQTVVSIAKQKITQFNAIEEQKRREAEEALRQANKKLQTKLNEEAKTKGITAVELPRAIIPKKSTVTRTETGSSHSVKYWTFEIIEPHYIRQLATDLQIQWNKMLDQIGTFVVIPEVFKDVITSIDKLVKTAPYLVWSDHLIREAVLKSGIREIPSVKIWEKEDTKFKT